MLLPLEPRAGTELLRGGRGLPPGAGELRGLRGAECPQVGGPSCSAWA